MTTKFDIIRLKSLAALGNVEAMYTLGTNYLYGVGVDVDLEEAHSYFVKAADKGLMAANELMKFVFADNGNSIEIEPEYKENGYELIKQICQSADKGDPGALHLKAMAKLSDETDDFRFYRAVKHADTHRLQPCRQGSAHHRCVVGRWSVQSLPHQCGWARHEPFGQQSRHRLRDSSSRQPYRPCRSDVSSL